MCFIHLAAFFAMQNVDLSLGGFFCCGCSLRIPFRRIHSLPVSEGGLGVNIKGVLGGLSGF